MKYCTKCGNELMDEAVVCPKCGCAIEKTAIPGAPVKPKGIQVAAKVLMILSTVIGGFALIPLAWCIPMTVSYSRKIKNGEYVETGFKVCTLLFVNLIAGILMLCDSDD